MGTLVEALRAGALADPATTAVRFLHRDTDVLSRGALDARARALAGALQHQGGQRVLLAVHPGPDLLIGLLACWYAGVTAVPCRPGHTDRFVTIGTLADVAVIVSREDLRARWTGHPVRWLSIDAAGSWTPPSVGPDDVVLLQCPSGSTETAKAVVVTERAMLTQLASFRDLVGLEPGFSVVNWAPMDGTLGMELMLLSVFVGGEATWLAPEDVTARPFLWLRAVSQARGPVLSGGPTFAYDQCVERISARERDTLDLRRWHTALIGAERVRPSTVERFVSTFAPCGLRSSTLMPTYGLTEVMQGIAAQRGPSTVEHDGHTWVPVGRPAPGARVVVVDSAGAVCPDGAVGELWISGPMVCQGYWRDPVRTAEVFDARLADGSGPFLRTGDLGFQADDRLVVCGRLKEIIIMRGRNFHPEDIELASQRSIGNTLPAAAFSVDGPDGERLVVVQTVESAPADAADTIRRAVIAAHGVEVHEVVLVGPDGVPRTATGKVRRVACRQAYLDGALAPVGGAASSPVAVVDDPMPLRDMVSGLPFELREPVVGSEVRRRVAELLNSGAPAELPGDTPLMLLGLESVRMIALRHGLEQDFGVSLPIADFVVLSIDDVVGVIVKQL